MSIAQNFPNLKPSLLLDFSNTEALDSRVTFARASTARFYDGRTVAKAEENLQINSQAFNTGWSLNGGAVTADNATAPDGTSTADTLTLGATTATHGVISFSGSAFSGETQTVSFFVKKGNHRYIALGLYRNTSNNAGAGFDLDTNTVTGTGGGGTGYSASGATITDVGNGWYRCSVVCVSGSITSTGPSLFLRNTAYTSGVIQESWTAAGTETIILWGAQLEQRSAVTAYTPTTTQPITNYIPALQTAAAGVARFDHNPITGESLGLLIEEQRTNLLLRSEEFDNASWAKGNGAITANTVVSPDGTLSGDRLVSSASTAATFVQQSFTSTAQAYVASFYVKSAGAQFVQLLWSGAQSTNHANFDLANGTVGTNTATAASITFVGNGWYRIAITSTLSAASGSLNLYAVPSSTSGRAASFAGDGWSGIYIWGAQLEAGAFPTSYIPTVASQVTRSADAASMTGANFSSWYRADEGTLYADVVFNSGSINTDQLVFQIDNGSASERHKISRFASVFYGTSRTAGTTWVDSALGTANANTAYKVAYSFKTNDFAGTSNAGTVATDTSGLVSPSLTAARFGSQVSGEQLNGTIKKIAYYPLRLINTQLQGLTS